MTRYLSKSDLKIARSCATKLYYQELRYPSLNDEDEYLALLAEAGFVVEAIAKLLYPSGQEIGFDKDNLLAALETLRALSAENCTLFESTLISGQKLARVDILLKRGMDFDLIEVKSKSYSSVEDEEAKADGCANIFRSRLDGSIRSDWQEYLEDVAFQVLVLQELFPRATIQPFLMMPDRSKSTQIDQLLSWFRMTRIQRPGSSFARARVEFLGNADRLRGDHFLTLVPVQEEVRDLMDAVRSSAAHYVASIHPELRKIQVPISVACKGCEFRATRNGDRDGFKECWGQRADVRPHLLDLYHVSEIGGRNTPLANTLIEQGKVSLFDVPADALVKADGDVGENNRRQRIQIDHTRSNTEWVSRSLPGILRSFRYPLRFIDFETTALAIPYHAGMSPYETVAFQWSCHTLRSPDGKLEHEEWINVVDAFPNFDFAQSLMSHVGTTGTLFMWASHENTILGRILEQMAIRNYRNPALAAWLRSTVRMDGARSGRLIDMNQLTLKSYFHPLMKGRTSIKVVVDAIWKSNPKLRQEFPEYLKMQGEQILSPYDALPTLTINGKPVVVAEGTGAVRAYEAMLYGVEKSDPVLRERWKRLLLQYCKLDTASMVMVWRHWGDATQLQVVK